MSDAAINLTNQFLIAMPGMTDDNFTGTVVYLCEHNAQGALGLVINRPITLTLKALMEKVDLDLERNDLSDMTVYFGGPVQTERGFVLHDALSAPSGPPRQAAPVPTDTADAPSPNLSSAGTYNSSLAIPGGLEMTTSKDVLEAIAHGAGPRRVFVTLGYSGWSAGQLEDELSRNGWLSVAAHPDIIFDTPVEKRYESALGLLGINLGMLSSDVGHA